MNKWQHQLIFTEWWTWQLQSMVINDKWVLGQEDSLWVRTPTYLLVYLRYCKYLNSPPIYLILQECIWTTRNRHFTRDYTFYRHPAWTSHVCIDCSLRNMYWFAYNYYETLLRFEHLNYTLVQNMTSNGLTLETMNAEGESIRNSTTSHWFINISLQ